MEKITLTREELHRLVWSEPMITLSRKYDISDVGLRKACVRLGVPLPQMGHWNKPLSRRPKPWELSKSHTGPTDITLKPREESVATQSKNAAIKALLKEIKSDRRLSLTVPKALTNPDPLITAAKQDMSTGGYRGRYSYKGVVNSGYDRLSIRTTLANIARVLRFMDTLIKALRARGHSISIKNGMTYAAIRGEEIKIYITDKFKPVTVKGTYRDETEHHATGQILFKTQGIGARQYQDRKLTLEQQLPIILAGLELDAQRYIDHEVRWEIIRQESRIKQEKEEEIRMRPIQELAAFKNLLTKSARYHRALQLRQYLQAAETNALAAGPLTPELQTWLSWAQAKADWYDPLIEKEDPLLYKVNKETLSSN